jgi:hypothetical protein
MRNAASSPRARPRFWLRLGFAIQPRDAERYGHRLCLQVLSQQPEDHHAVAV